MSRTARTPTISAAPSAAPGAHPRSRAIAQAAERALHPPIAPAPAPEQAPKPAPERAETNEQAHASEEISAAPVEDADAGAHGGPAQTARPVRGGILHSKRDVEQAMARVNQAVAAFAQRGMPVHIDSLDLNTLRPRGQAIALCRLLVQKGIVTQEEIQYEEASAWLEMLTVIYQKLEERALAELRGVQTVRQPDLIVPGR